MPLYEYQCKKCHHRFELIRKFSDPPIKKCPECGGVVEQTVTAPAVQFKGSGWYVTDYPKKSSGSAGSGDSASKSDSKDKNESKDKSESKDKTESTSKKEDKPKAETSSKKTEKK